MSNEEVEAFEAAFSADESETNEDVPAEAKEETEATNEAEPTGETVSEPTSPSGEELAAPKEEPEPNTVPRAALLDEREKRQEASEQISKLTAEIEQLKAAQTRAAENQSKQPQSIPDPYEDPEGFARYNQSVVAEQLRAQEIDFSKRLVQQQMGAEFKGLEEWVKQKVVTDPMFSRVVGESKDPWQDALKQYKDEQILSNVGGDEAAYKQKIIDEYLAANPQPQPAVPTDPQPPQVLNAGGRAPAPTIPTDDEYFGAVFERK